MSRLSMITGRECAVEMTLTDFQKEGVRNPVIASRETSVGRNRATIETGSRTGGTKTHRVGNL